jgi:hypothetical protein
MESNFDTALKIAKSIGRRHPPGVILAMTYATDGVAGQNSSCNPRWAGELKCYTGDNSRMPFVNWTDQQSTIQTSGGPEYGGIQAERCHC